MAPAAADSPAKAAEVPSASSSPAAKAGTQGSAGTTGTSSPVTLLSPKRVSSIHSPIGSCPSRGPKKDSWPPFGSATDRGLLPAASVPTPSRSSAEYLKQVAAQSAIASPPSSYRSVKAPSSRAGVGSVAGDEVAAGIVQNRLRRIGGPSVASAARQDDAPPSDSVSSATDASTGSLPARSSTRAETAAEEAPIGIADNASASSGGGSQRRNPSLQRYLDHVNEGRGSQIGAIAGGAGEHRLGRSSSVTTLTKSSATEPPKKNAGTRPHRPPSPAGIVRPRACQSAAQVNPQSLVGSLNSLHAFAPAARASRSSAALAVEKSTSDQGGESAEEKCRGRVQDDSVRGRPADAYSHGQAFVNGGFETLTLGTMTGAAEKPAAPQGAPAKESAADAEKTSGETAAETEVRPSAAPHTYVGRDPTFLAEGFKAFGVRARAESPMVSLRGRPSKPAMEASEECSRQACACGNVFFEDDLFCRKCGSKKPPAAAPGRPRARADTLPPGSRRSPRATESQKTETARIDAAAARKCDKAAKKSDDNLDAHKRLQRSGAHQYGKVLKRPQEGADVTKRSSTVHRMRLGAHGLSPQKHSARTPPKSPMSLPTQSLSPPVGGVDARSPAATSLCSTSSHNARSDVSPITLSGASSGPDSPDKDCEYAATDCGTFCKIWGAWQSWDEEGFGESVIGASGVPPPPASLRSCMDPGALFEQFRTTDDMPLIFSSFRQMFRLAVGPKSGGSTSTSMPPPPWAQGVRRRPWRYPYEALRVLLGGHWRAKHLWERLDARCGRPEYGSAPCSQGRLRGRQIVVVGAGPAGLRAALELRLLGARVTVLEKREKFTRLNRLHLWHWCGEELKAFGARILEPPPADFGADPDLLHIGISELQLLLLKTALLLGVQVVTGAEYRGVDWASGGWSVLVRHAGAESKDGGAPSSVSISPPTEASLSGVAVVIGAGGLACPVPRSVGMESIEADFTEAIGLVANFTPLVPKSAAAQQKDRSLRSFSLARQFFESLFRRLTEETGADLENIVYTRSKTSHYFVMTPRSKCLAECGVLRDLTCKPLLAPANVDTAALDALVRRVVAFNFKDGQATLAEAAAEIGSDALVYADSGPRLFDFSKMKRAVDGLAFVQTAASADAAEDADDLLVLLAGDSLVEPFWPEGLGVVRGFFGALDASNAALLWAAGESPDVVKASHAAAFGQLKSLGAASRGRVLRDDEAAYSTAPSTRYRALNRASGV